MSVFTRPGQVELFQIARTDETECGKGTQRILLRSRRLLGEPLAEFIAQIRERRARCVCQQSDEDISPIGRCTGVD